MRDFIDIPIIDVAALDSSNSAALQALGDTFADAYSRVGFSYIVNHGIDQCLIDAVFAASKDFHALPLATKMGIELNELHRGYIPINTSTDVNSTLADVRKPNQSESFMMMREAGEDDPDVRNGAFLAGPNQWPAGLPRFRAAVSAYANALTALGERLVHAIALGLGTDAERFGRYFERPTTWLRLLHYPPQAASTPDDLYGSAPHCDFGCITILAQDDVGGLQVRTPAGKWIDAPPIPGTFVVNAGDMLHRWSNGRLRSTPHRVVNRSGRERYSCPFFFDPNVAVDIAPLDACVSRAAPARFEPVNFGDFLRQELEAAYDRHKPPANTPGTVVR